MSPATTTVGTQRSHQKGEDSSGGFNLNHEFSLIVLYYRNFKFTEAFIN